MKKVPVAAVAVIPLIIFKTIGKDVIE